MKCTALFRNRLGLNAGQLTVSNKGAIKRLSRFKSIKENALETLETREVRLKWKEAAGLSPSNLRIQRRNNRPSVPA